MGPLPPPVGREHGVLVRGELPSIALESGQFKHVMGARDDAVVVRARSARKLETVVLLTKMDAIRDQAAQAILRDGWI